MAIIRRKPAISTSATPTSTDPWKVLVKKLGTDKKSTAGAIGKVLKTDITVVDELQCKHFDTCSGCSMRGNFTESPIVKRARIYFKSEGISFPIHLGNKTEWRTHAKLAVQPLSRWGGLKVK
jgi:hypothetical protein